MKYRFEKVHWKAVLLFDGGVHYLIETSQSICSANQLADLYMIGSSFIKELKTTDALKFVTKTCKKQFYSDIFCFSFETKILL